MRLRSHWIWVRDQFYCLQWWYAHKNISKGWDIITKRQNNMETRQYTFHLMCYIIIHTWYRSYMTRRITYGTSKPALTWPLRNKFKKRPGFLAWSNLWITGKNCKQIHIWFHHIHVQRISGHIWHWYQEHYGLMITLYYMEKPFSMQMNQIEKIWSYVLALGFMYQNPWLYPRDLSYSQTPQCFMKIYRNGHAWNKFRENGKFSGHYSREQDGDSRKLQQHIGCWNTQKQ